MHVIQGFRFTFLHRAQQSWCGSLDVLSFHIVSVAHVEQLRNVFILLFLGISRLVEEGVYCAAYPLHVVSFCELLLREKLNLFWLNKRNYTQL